MKINSANSTNFQAITYRPGCQKYVAEYLTSRDKGVLRRAERAMSRCRKWDLEITSKGLLYVKITSCFSNHSSKILYFQVLGKV